MPRFASPHLAMPGLGQGSGPGFSNATKVQKIIGIVERLLLRPALVGLTALVS